MVFVSPANSGLPGAGYWKSNNSCGNPPKSWIVIGFCIAVTKVPFVSQCADIHKIALGVGNVFPISFHFLENSLSSIAFIGLPCPRNNTGICSILPGSSVSLLNSFSFINVPAKYFIVSVCRISIEKWKLKDQEYIIAEGFYY